MLACLSAFPPRSSALNQDPKTGPTEPWADGEQGGTIPFSPRIEATGRSQVQDSRQATLDQEPAFVDHRRPRGATSPAALLPNTHPNLSGLTRVSSRTGVPSHPGPSPP